MISTQAYPFVGLELSTSHFKLALVESRPAGFELGLLAEGERSSGLPPIEESAFWITSLRAQSALVRPLRLALTKARDIDQVFRFEAESLIPYPLDSAVLDRIIVQQDDESTLLALVSTRQDHLLAHLEECQALGLDPEAVGIPASGLAALNPFLHGDEGPRILIYLSRESATCALVEGNRLRLAVDGPHGAGALGDAPAKITAMERWLRQATHTLIKNIPQSTRLPIILLGEGALDPSLSNRLRDLFPDQITDASPHSLTGAPSEDIIRYAAPIGLALGYAQNPHSQVNLRRDAQAHPKPWKRIQTPLAIFCGLALLLALITHLFASHIVDRKHVAAKIGFQELLSGLQIDRDSFEQDFAAAYGLPAEPPEAEVDRDGLAERIAFLGEKIDKQARSFPLTPAVPRVSDLLAWLSTHPKVVKVDEVSGGSTALLELASLNYTMVKRPTKGQLRDKYQVKVDLEVTTDNSLHAREFHDALLESNAFIDAKQNVTWNTSKEGRYKASFFLKSKRASACAEGA